jgi:hypothetical protein
MQKKLQNPPTSKLTAGEYVAKLTEMGAAQARESFYWFRRLIRPHMLKFGRVRRAQPHTTMRNRFSKPLVITAVDRVTSSREENRMGHRCFV